MREQIAAGLADLGLVPPPQAAQQLARYGALLLEQNKVMNLTAITDPAQVASLHMLDSAALLTAAEFQGKTLIDVGTGAGFPGLALKILVPGCTVTLLDSLGKRVDWLASVADCLGLQGVQAIHGRAEELALDPRHRERYDIATARAVAELRVLCELCLPYVAVGGTFLAMKGPDCAQEVAAAQSALHTLGGAVEEIRPYAIPGSDVRHCTAVIRKVAPTPKGYPRRWAKVQKNPL